MQIFKLIIHSFKLIKGISILLIMGICLLCVSVNDSYPQEMAWGPAKFYKEGHHSKEYYSNQNLLNLSVKFYQRVLRNIIARRCPSYPSCSTYSRLVLKRYGIIKGIIMTTDRLIHEGDQIKIGPKIWANGRWKVFDPPRLNDFWKKPKEK